MNPPRPRRLHSGRGGTAMSTSLKQIEEQARALSAEDRAKLAEALLESLHAPPQMTAKRTTVALLFRLACMGGLLMSFLAQGQSPSATASVTPLIRQMVGTWKVEPRTW